MKPATPLPWVAKGDEDHAFIIGGNPQEILADCSIDRVRPIEDKTNAAYIVAAANAYPRLVEALRRIAILAGNGEMGPSRVAEVNHLLRDLGEL